MKSSIAIIATILATTLTFACKQKDESGATPAPTATAASTSEIPGTTSPNDLSPMKAQSFIDDVTIGHEVAADGTIPAGKTGDNFVPGQKVYITMKVNNAPANTAVKVVFNGPPGTTKIADETKNVPTGATFLKFEKDTKGWPKGDYSADIFAGDEKVNTQHFNLADASAGKK